MNLLPTSHVSTSAGRIAAAVGIVALLWAPNATAEGRHSSPVPTAAPAAPNANVHGYKLDHELEFRAAHQGKSTKTRAIVSLQPGASLPPELARFAKHRLG